MPWPFRRHRSPQAGAPSSAAAPPVTIDDFSSRRRLTVHVGGWQHVDPLTPTATGAAAPVVSSGASFISGLAGTRPLLPSTTLREVSPDAPRGVTQGLARPLPSGPYAAAPDEGGGQPVSAAQFAPEPPMRRAVVTSRAPARADLTTYAGDLSPAEPEPVWFDEPQPEGSHLEVRDGDIPEELPPPIFSTLLAERTGRPLSEIRPDLADTEGDGGAKGEDGSGVEQPQRKRSLAESRRLGLGPPRPQRRPHGPHLARPRPAHRHGSRLTIPSRATVDPEVAPVHAGPMGRAWKDR